MIEFYRRVLLTLLGALITGVVSESADAATTKKSTPTPTPKKSTPTTTPKKPTPTPKKPTPTPTPKKPTPTPTQSAKASPTPSTTHSKVPEGIFIAKSSDLLLRQTKIFVLKDSFGISTRSCLTRNSRGVFAFDTKCTHAGAPTALQGTELLCPAHGSVFDSQTGRVITGPAVEPLKSYRTVEVNGEIRIVIA